MNQPSIEHTTTCAEDLAGNDPKKSVILEIMDHCGLGYFLSSAIRKVALHQTDDAGVCAMWGRTSEADKAFFIINAPRPNPFYPIQDSYISFLKGRYSGNIEAMANSEKTNQEALDTDLKEEKVEIPIACPVQDAGTLDGQTKAVDLTPDSHRGFMMYSDIENYRPVVESPDGNCAHTLPTLKEFLLGTGKDIKQLRDTFITYRNNYKRFPDNSGEGIDQIIRLLDTIFKTEMSVYDDCRAHWDPFVDDGELLECPNPQDTLNGKPMFR